MYIQTDNDGNIIQFISVGGKPAENGYELPTDTSDEIIQNIFSYKYIDGELVKKDESDIEKLDIVKQAKISSMSTMCNQTIINGVDWNGEHYSLTLEDQNNINNLKDMVSISEYIPYHPDGNGGNCTFFTAEEFTQFYTYCFQFKLYHLTYYNQLKGYINSLTSVDAVLDVNYGMGLTGEYHENLVKYTNGLELEIEEVEDTYNYNAILFDINIDELVSVETIDNTSGDDVLYEENVE